MNLAEDLRIKISAKVDDSSQAINNLQSQLDTISSKLKLNVNIDTKQIKEATDAISKIKDQASKQGNGIKVIDDKEVNKAKQFVTSIDEAVKRYKELGTVKVNKILDPSKETETLKGFNIEIQKTNGLIEKLTFESAKLNNIHGVDGFVLTKQTESDKRSMVMQESLSKTLQKRQQEERKLAETQAQAVNKNIEAKQKEIQKQEELRKKLQDTLVLYQKNAEIQARTLLNTNKKTVNKSELDVWLKDVKSLNAETPKLQQKMRELSLGFKDIKGSATDASRSSMSVMDAFNTAMVKFPINFQVGVKLL